MTLKTAAELTTVDTISHAMSECGLGPVLVARSAAGVCAILIGANNDELVADLAARFPEAKLVANAAIVQDDLAKVTRFIDRPSKGLDLPLDLRGTPFQRRVWETVRTIPVGTTITYTELARSIGAPNSVRAVAGACASNPAALAVPCHRVVASNGDLGGYYWGVERKRELIEKEAMA
jgi:AraC family transcriptional regulator, regulatory protein of adaptative response / methylated-DNA-[protein]-cysteine methyltransferase